MFTVIESDNLTSSVFSFLLCRKSSVLYLENKSQSVEHVNPEV